MIRPRSFAATYRFGWFEADLASGELRHRGRLVVLQEKPLQILQLLLIHAGQLVSREQLRHELWPPDTVVDFDRGLNTAMNKLRGALRDPARSSRFIQTLHGRGYRFIAPVARLEAGRPVDSGRRQRITGEHLWNRRDPAALQRALGAFQEMIDEDPVSAPGYSGLALCWCMLGDYGWMPPADAFPRARAAATRALELDPEHAEAHAALGFVLHRREWRWRAAEDEYRRAVELDPRCATVQHWYAEFLSQRGRHPEALMRIATARELDPLSAIITTVEAWIHLHAGRFESAVACVRRSMTLRDNFPITLYLLSRIRLAQGRLENARSSILRAVEAQPESAFIRAQLAIVHAASDATELAVSILSELRADSQTSPYLIAKIVAALGRTPEAFEELERGVEQRSSWMLDLWVDPELDTLRPEPRWREIEALMLDAAAEQDPSNSVMASGETAL